MDSPAGKAAPSVADLFWGFLTIGLLGFGGVAPWARHLIVTRRRWLDDEDYGTLLGICQTLPGANTVNAAIMIGDRFRGGPGAVASVLGLMIAPLMVLVGFATLYSRYGGHPDVQAGLDGAAAAAAGLIIGTALKLIRRIRLTVPAWICGGAAFCAAAILRLPLAVTLALLIPVSVAGAAWVARRK